MTSRNLKIRSVENGVYNKTKLTRMRFELPSDMMVSDMGNSYLSLRTEITNAAGLPVVTKPRTGEASQYFSFGDGDNIYTGSSMFRTCKLFNKKTGQVIEEINYSNIKCATFEQLTTDIDMMGSDTIQSGAAIDPSILGNIQANYSLWVSGNPAEIHIPLKSLFPSLNTPVWSLQQMPLIVDLELDTTHEIFMKTTANLYVVAPPALVGDGQKGYTDTALAPQTWLVESQLNKEFGAVQSPQRVLRPEFWEYVAEDYLKEPMFGVRDGTGNVAPIGSLELSTGWATANLTELGFIDATRNQHNPVEMVIKIKDATDVDIQDFIVETVFETATPSTDGQSSVIKLEALKTYEAVVNTHLGNHSATLETFKAASVSCLLLQPAEQASYGNLLLEKKHTLSEVDIPALIANGLLKEEAGVVSVVADVTFNLKLRIATMEIDGITENIIVSSNTDLFESAGTNYFVSNAMLKMPRYSLGEVTMKIVAFDAGTRQITFDLPLGLAADAGIGLLELGFFNTNNAGVIAPATHYRLMMTNVKQGGQDAIVGERLVGAYPTIDKAEMVLKQYAATSAKMPGFLRTMKVEPFVINEGFSEFNQTFQVEANCYNAFVLLPPNTQVGSMISKGRNVGRWRASIDEVDVTNTDVVLGEFPKSLYFDKLVDAFSNSSMQLRTLEGIVGGAGSPSVRVLPIKMYNGLVGGQVFMSPSMKRLAIRASSLPGQLIEGGTAFLFKECYVPM